MTASRPSSGLLAGALALAVAIAAHATPAGPADVDGPGVVADQRPAIPSDLDLIGRTPLPPGAKIVNDQSMIIGSGETWLGRLSLDVGHDSAAAYSFFIDRFPQDGWVLQSAVRGKTSLLVFTRPGRTATIEFQESKLVGGGQVIMTMAPVFAERGQSGS